MNTGSKTGVSGQGSAVRKDKKKSVFYITDSGLKLAQKLKRFYPDAQIVKFTSVGARRAVPLHWSESRNLIFIMATGIVVRTIAPLLKDKRTDPAVVVLDEKGRYAISLLSGHLGGANKLAGEIADFLGAQAVITTASDVQGKVALDLWAEAMGLYVEDFERLRKMSVWIVNGRDVKVKVEGISGKIKLPSGLVRVKTVREADMIISHRVYKKEVLYLRPKVLCVGIGCNRGTTDKEIGEAVGSLFGRAGLSPRSISVLASIDLKKDEEGLAAFARDNGLEIEFFGKDALNRTAEENDIRGSGTVKAATGAVAVAEPAALLSAKRISGEFSLIRPKEKRGNVTLAIAKLKLAL